MIALLCAFAGVVFGLVVGFCLGVGATKKRLVMDLEARERARLAQREARLSDDVMREIAERERRIRSRVS